MRNGMRDVLIVAIVVQLATALRPFGIAHAALRRVTAVRMTTPRKRAKAKAQSMPTRRALAAQPMPEVLSAFGGPSQLSNSPR